MGYIDSFISLIVEARKHDNYKCLEVIENLFEYLVEKHGLKVVLKDLFKNGIVVVLEPKKLWTAIFQNEILKLFKLQYVSSCYLSKKLFYIIYVSSGFDKKHGVESDKVDESIIWLIRNLLEEIFSNNTLSELGHDYQCLDSCVGLLYSKYSDGSKVIELIKSLGYKVTYSDAVEAWIFDDDTYGIDMDGFSFSNSMSFFLGDNEIYDNEIYIWKGEKE